MEVFTFTEEGKADFYYPLGQALKLEGKVEKCIEYLEAAKRHYKEAGKVEAVPRVLRALSYAYCIVGDTKRSKILGIKALEMSISKNNEQGNMNKSFLNIAIYILIEVVGCNWTLGAAYALNRTPKLALNYLKASVDLSPGMGQEQKRANALSHYGNALRLNGDVHKAEDALNEAMKIFEDTIPNIKHHGKPNM